MSFVHVISKVAMILATLLLTSCGVTERFMFYGKGMHTAPVVPADIKQEEIWVHSRDGVTLNGTIVYGAPDAPLVIYFPGIDGNDSDCGDTLRVLHRVGLNVCIFDYRGYGKSRGQVTGEKDLYEDGRSIIRYLEERGWGHDGVIYFGQSLGAAVAIQMGLEAEPAGLVLESPFTSLADMGEHLAPVTFSLFGRWSISSKLDNARKIPSIRAPLLFVVGENDKTTPVPMSLRLFELASAPKRLHVVRGGGHCDAAKCNATAFAVAWQDFLGAF